MKRKLTALLLASASLLAFNAEACTNLLITKGASTDGSTMITYTADSHQLYDCLYHSPAAMHAEGSMLDVYEWDTGKYKGQIEQTRITYSTVGNMNEHQLIIAETTYGGRGLANPTGIMDYGSLIYITLQRAKTAREAIEVMAGLVERYGYCSSGESFSIADPNEVWHMEMIGKGDRELGAVWVALRIPDGYIGGHANQARIMNFPLNDPENCLYSPDVITFARDMGYFKGADSQFSFCDAYAPLDFGAMRACEARVWSAFNRVADGMGAYVDYAMGYDASKRMPLFVKPTRKISPKDVMWLMRDHYEDTPMDMRNDIGAGGHNNPYRWRPMSFTVDGQEYLNERATATQQTGFWFVGQARSWLPNAIGGINWFGVDDTGTSCLTPIYTSTRAIPECFREGNGHMTEYSPTAAFWVFNRVANFAYLRYDLIAAEIHNVIHQVENQNFAEIPAIDAEALELYNKDPEAAIQFLENYSATKAQWLFNVWSELDKFLLVKYIDGNVKKEKDGVFQDNGSGKQIPIMPDFPGYNDEWKKAVAGSTGDRLKKVTPRNLPE